VKQKTALVTAGRKEPGATAQAAVSAGAGKAPDGMLNVMTVDVEEHFQVSAFDDLVTRVEWGKLPSRVEASTERLLGLLEEAGTRATFFVLGWLGERHTALVRRIADAGHEIACHGYSHRLVYQQDPEVFREEARRGRALLQDASGQPVNGYRAASFSIRRENLWALDVLAEAGFAYDSSVFPVTHDRYGIPDAPRGIHRRTTPGGMSLIEVPPSTLVVGRLRLPVAGGGYLRLLPGAVTRWVIRRLNRVDRMPAVVYVHPWELDPAQPRVRAPFSIRFRHYYGLKSTRRKLRDLLRQFRFGRIRDIIEQTEVPSYDGNERPGAGPR
jgi:polysaccharide deacetylase family protein (PEP-CTERM system associated)